MTPPPPRTRPTRRTRRAGLACGAHRATLRATLLAATCVACVQPAHERVVVYEVDVSRAPALRAAGMHVVGIRGGDQPLSWERDAALVAVRPDSLYRTVVTYRTGALVTEVKFTVDGAYEFANGDNRTIRFAPLGDTTIVRATFDVR
jgi:hypothetical protein